MSRQVVRSFRWVAVLEVIKGIAVCLVALAAVVAVSQGIGEAAGLMALWWPTAPSSGGILPWMVDSLTGIPMWAIAGGATAYGLMRFAEAYGLWFGHRWATWLGAVSGALFLPVEVAELIREATWTVAMIFAVNTAVVGYLVVNLRRGSLRIVPARSRP